MANRVPDYNQAFSSEVLSVAEGAAGRVVLAILDGQVVSGLRH